MLVSLCVKCTFYLYAFRRGEGVSEKSTLCTLVKMAIIMDDPLDKNRFSYQPKEFCYKSESVCGVDIVSQVWKVIGLK